ncbi:MAG: hypothetical protein KC656_11680, partial [Myxococcales bacterium]|nr:hypothetical protein [Myxococcales bacterium]
MRPGPLAPPRRPAREALATLVGFVVTAGVCNLPAPAPATPPTVHCRPSRAITRIEPCVSSDEPAATLASPPAMDSHLERVDEDDLAAILESTTPHGL